MKTALLFSLLVFMGTTTQAQSLSDCQPLTPVSATSSTTELFYSKIAFQLQALYAGSDFFFENDKEKTEHPAQVAQKIRQGLTLLGYEQVSVEQVLTCAKKGQSIDFDLLRYSLLNYLRRYFIL